MPYDICEDEVTLDYIETEMAKRGNVTNSAHFINPKIGQFQTRSWKGN